ncbi:hypothetical protein CABS01_16688 [Colletotrichum abscissum]|uniref:uncharacterized protein n=1 Tax=Colletotrichum abscissum TaxID=1671311 RepID=UPI0027D56F71|nr:uncharacterized protein CABS01_16688 [Colletotrichum abscissum]KAK1517226.1 hypothetical protein CABS01_16688 [Colletotrichum abscissum]
MIPSTDDDSLPETSPLLKPSRILYEPSETPEEQLGHVFSNIGRDINKIGMQPKITHHKLPVKHHRFEEQPLLGDRLASTIIKFIGANVAIAREGSARPGLHDQLVEAAILEISDPAFHAYCN